MAITIQQIVTPTFSVSSGSQRRVAMLAGGIVALQCDNSYPAGGYALTPALFGFEALAFVIPLATNDGRLACWDQANQRLKLHAQPNSLSVNAALPEVANGTNVSSTTVFMLVSGS